MSVTELPSHKLDEPLVLLSGSFLPREFAKLDIAKKGICINIGEGNEEIIDYLLYAESDSYHYDEAWQTVLNEFCLRLGGVPHSICESVRGELILYPSDMDGVEVGGWYE